MSLESWTSYNLRYLCIYEVLHLIFLFRTLMFEYAFAGSQRNFSMAVFWSVAPRSLAFRLGGLDSGKLVSKSQICTNICSI
jgi:hypothetical protein